jgi:hypothetical protein
MNAVGMSADAGIKSVKAPKAEPKAVEANVQFAGEGLQLQKAPKKPDQGNKVDLMA